MAGGTLDVQPLFLLVEATDGDAEELCRVVGQNWVVRRATADQPVGELARLDGLSVVLLCNPGAGDLSRWRAGLEVAGSRARLLALAHDVDDPRLAGWLAAGADDFAFRSLPKLLPTTLLRLERDREEREQRARDEERLRASTGALLLLARSAHFRGDDLDAAVRDVTQAGVRGLSVERCGLWLLDETETTLRLLDRYDARTQQHVRGEQLGAQEYRPTMGGLLSQRLVATSDAKADRRFKDFVGDDVGSAIVVALLQRGELAGVLLLEHRGPSRRWTAEEEAYAGALADVAALALESAEIHHLEWALSQSEKRFQDLFLHTSDGTALYRVALDGTISFEDINPAAEASTGLKRDDLIGYQVREVFEPKSAAKLEERYAQAIATRSVIVFEHDLELPTGTRWFNTAVVPLFDETGRVHRLAAIARDVTAQRESAARERRLEIEVADAQKNEALARFATHVAHDVNNLLTVIVAYAQRLDPLPGRIGETGQAIVEATRRGRELTQQILTFGRQRPPELKPLELGPLVCTALRLLEATTPGVSMSIDVPAHPFRVMGDEGQLNQVLTNLCTNALNALPNGQGTLTVALKAMVVDGPFARRHPPLRAGPAVRLSVSDTGSGMDEPTVRRIFEPFFSARPDGSGAGLGLAVVETIVEGHDGVVVVDSTPGQGSTFHVYLPSLEGEESRPGSGQRVMLVDDHPGMARVSAKLLETLGYHTSVFDDPRDALAAFRARPADFDVVMTDLSMPQMSGEEFSRSLREIAPRVPVIVSSGMASEADREELHRQGFAGVLLKPWRLEDAVATLKRVLPASSAT